MQHNYMFNSLQNLNQFESKKHLRQCAYARKRRRRSLGGEEAPITYNAAMRDKEHAERFAVHQYEWGALAFH